jgi:hypothetical protein
LSGRFSFSIDFRSIFSKTNKTCKVIEIVIFLNSLKSHLRYFKVRSRTQFLARLIESPNNFSLKYKRCFLNLF